MLGGTKKMVSNLEKCVQQAIDLSRKLATVWDLSDYKGKQVLQFLLFPDGISYDRKNEQCRTSEVSPVFPVLQAWSGFWPAQKKATTRKN